PPVLRTRPERSGADRVRGVDAHRRPLPDRGRHPRPFRRRAPRHPPGTQPPAGRSTPPLAAREAVADQPENQARRGIRYALSRWAGLCLFLEDGRIEIDNNAVERAIRPLALNRKNALFAGSDGGAEHWAVIASLIETCKLLGVEPHGYLADVITRIVNGHPQSRLNDLLPWVYPAMPQFKAAA